MKPLTRRHFGTILLAGTGITAVMRPELTMASPLPKDPRLFCAIRLWFSSGQQHLFEKVPVTHVRADDDTTAYHIGDVCVTFNNEPGRLVKVTSEWGGLLPHKVVASHSMPFNGGHEFRPGDSLSLSFTQESITFS